MNALRKAINTNLLTLNLVERALNESTGWTMQFGSQVVQAQVIVSERAVAFWASFAFDADVEPFVFILHNGDMLAAREVRPNAGAAVFEFELVLEPERIAV